MNTAYLTLILWVASMVVQFVAYLYLTAKQRGKDEDKLTEIDELREKVETLEVALVSHSLRLENIVTYLESKNGVTFRRQ